MLLLDVRIHGPGFRVRTADMSKLRGSELRECETDRRLQPWLPAKNAAQVRLHSDVQGVGFMGFWGWGQRNVAFVQAEGT